SVGVAPLDHNADQDNAVSLGAHIRLSNRQDIVDVSSINMILLISHNVIHNASNSIVELGIVQCTVENVQTRITLGARACHRQGQTIVIIVVLNILSQVVNIQIYYGTGGTVGSPEHLVAKRDCLANLQHIMNFGRVIDSRSSSLDCIS